jgi:hypothetical protein
MSNDTDTDLIVPDELTSLKSRADLLGVKYHPSIGVDALRDKVNAAVTAEGPVKEAATTEPIAAAGAVETASVAETDGQLRARKKREANELIRMRVTCMNPSKAEWDGEIFTAGNSVVGSFKKYIPFNADEGWHVPRIIYNQIKERECQIWVSSQDARGNTVRKGKLIKEFAIEIMDALTHEELTELARRQAASNAIAQ